jgi:hypothetical protein
MTTVEPVAGADLWYATHRVRLANDTAPALVETLDLFTYACTRCTAAPWHCAHVRAVQTYVLAVCDRQMKERLARL